MNMNRRDFFAGMSCAAAALLNGRYGAKVLLAAAAPENEANALQKLPLKEPEVTATEDLMREHGILRRALFVYSESADRLVSDPSKVPTDALKRAARLFRAFGEDYHEKKLEEAYIFPALKHAGVQAAAYVDTLIAQHNRGRQITEYIIAATQTPQVSDARTLAAVMRSMVRMYRPHAALEDTIIFPAWKIALGPKQLDEMGDKFEEIEHQQFGEDGFEKAVEQISEIEAQLGMADLSKFTAPPPPK